MADKVGKGLHQVWSPIIIDSCMPEININMPHVNTKNGGLFSLVCKLVSVVFALLVLSCGSVSDTSPSENSENDTTVMPPNYEIVATESITVQALEANGYDTKLVLYTLSVNETDTRQFVLHYDQQDTPTTINTLLFSFHGAGNSSIEPIYRSQAIKYDGKASESNFVFVYPFGASVEQSSGDSTYNWNLGGNDADGVAESTADDIAFIESIFDYLSSDFEYADRVDLTHVLGIGSSQGSAFLLNRLAPSVDFFTGICGQVSQLFTEDDPGYMGLGDDNSFRILYFYGYNDPIIPYEGGYSSVGHTFLSVQDSLISWANLLGISTDLETETYPSDQFASENDYKIDDVPYDIFYVYDDIDTPVHAYQHNKKHGMPTSINGKSVNAIFWDFFIMP